MKQSIAVDEEFSIKTRFDQDPKYRASCVELKKTYVTQLQVARYSQANQAFPNILVNAGKTNYGMTLFYISGLNQPQTQQEFKSFMSYFILQVDPHLNNGFILVYLNTGLMTHSHVSKFFQAYRSLPVEYYSKLANFYILHGNMFIKSWFWFQSGVQISVLKQKVDYVARLQVFADKDFFSMQQYVTIPQYVLVTDPSHQALKLALELKQSKNPSPVTQSMPVQAKQIIGLNVHEYELNDFGIPLCLDVLVNFLDTNPAYLCMEGIFRKNASGSNEKQLEEMLVASQYDDIKQVEDPYATAGVIKKIFNKMPDPIVPYEFYPTLVAQIPKLPLEEQLKLLGETLHQIPKLNYRVFAFIVGFLNKVTEFQDKNKMTMYNMSVVFAPCFFRPLEYTISDLQNSGVVVKMYQIIMENYNTLFHGEQYTRYLSRRHKMVRSSSSDNIQIKSVVNPKGFEQF